HERQPCCSNNALPVVDACSCARTNAVARMQTAAAATKMAVNVRTFIFQCRGAPPHDLPRLAQLARRANSQERSASVQRLVEKKGRVEIDPAPSLTAELQTR